MTNTIKTLFAALLLSVAACGGGDADIGKACENICDCLAPGDGNDECVDSCEGDDESSDACVACVAAADSCGEIVECENECD